MSMTPKQAFFPKTFVTLQKYHISSSQEKLNFLLLNLSETVSHFQQETVTNHQIYNTICHQIYNITQCLSVSIQYEIKFVDLLIATSINLILIMVPFPINIFYLII
jgi:hypothetical protein